MFWFVYSSHWHSAYAGGRMLHHSDGSLNETLSSLVILKRNDYQSILTGLTIHDVLTSRGCVYLTTSNTPLVLHRLPVARLAGRDIDQDSSWTVVEAYESRYPVPQPKPDCFPTLGARILAGWTQSAFFASSCLSVLIISVALLSHWWARPRTGSHTWITVATS